MTRIAVPYFMTEHLSELDLVVPADLTVSADLAPGTGWEPLVPLYDSVATVVAAVSGGGKCPVVLSGDCTTALGTVAGMQRGGVDPAIVWLDAHGDVQTMETTHSGFLGGMPLRLLAGYRPELMATPLGLTPVAEERIVLVDARDLDPPEAEYLAQSRIVHVPTGGLTAGVVPDGPVYLHIDLDIVNPRELAGLRYPAPGGPGMAEVAAAVRAVMDTGRVAAVGLACTWHTEVRLATRARTLLESMLPGVNRLS